MKVRDSVILGGMFLFLLVFYILQLTIFKPDESSFRTVLTQFDPDSINRIEWKHGGDETVIVKEKNIWKIAKPYRYLKADQSLIDTLLNSFSAIKTVLLVTRESSEWSEYGVDPAEGDLFSFFHGEERVSRVIMGASGYDKKSGNSYAYCRLPQENETYSIQTKPVFWVLNSHQNPFQLRKLWDFDPAEISSLHLTSGDQEEEIQKDRSGKWQYGTLPIDSFQMLDYLKKLSQLSASRFHDNFDIDQGFGVIQSLGLDEDLKLDCYLDEKGFVLKSSQNDSYILSDSSGLYQDVFIDLENLLIAAAQK